jgi:hypothetical protein
LGTTGAAASFGAAVTTGASSATKGTPAELVTAANNVRDSWGIRVWAFATGANATAGDCAVDILIGGATDDVLIPDLLVGGAHAAGAPRTHYFPVHVPAGVRIAAQAASRRTATAIRVGVELFGGGEPPHRVGRKVTTYGVGTVPNGTTLTVAASGGAASATQVTASTTEDHFAFAPGFQAINDSIIQTAGFTMVGIGVGAATEERIGTWCFAKNASEAHSGPLPDGPVFREVPASTRLTLLCSNSTNNDAGYSGVIYAVS